MTAYANDPAARSKCCILECVSGKALLYAALPVGEAYSEVPLYAALPVGEAYFEVPLYAALPVGEACFQSPELAFAASRVLDRDI